MLLTKRHTAKAGQEAGEKGQISFFFFFLDDCGCVPIKLYLRTLKLELHTTVMWNKNHILFFSNIKRYKNQIWLVCHRKTGREAKLANPGFRTHLPDITMRQVANITLTTSCSRAWESESSSRLVSFSSSNSQRRFWCLTSGHTACEWQCQAGAWVSWFKSYLPSPNRFQKSKFKISSTATKSFCHFSSALHHFFSF